jgi:alpha-mannosidase
MLALLAFSLMLALLAMPISRNPIEQSLTRAAVRISELAAWRDKEFQSIPEAKFFSSKYPSGTLLRLGDFWPTKECPVRLVFQCVIPESWVNVTPHIRFELGGEALLSVNGQPVGGLNPFHREHPIAASAGQQVTLETEVVPHGLFGTPTTEPRLDLVALVWPDDDVRSLLEDLVAIYDAAKYLHSSGRTELAQRLATDLHEALAGISLPRVNTEAYLARLASSSSSRSADDYYGNEESLASLWEDWRFVAAPATLSEEDRGRLRRIHQELHERISSYRDAEFGSVLLTGHAHIDLAWLWPLEETRRKARRTFYTVLSLMARYPNFYFNQSSAQLYAWIEQDDPALFEKIRARVREGRWEIIGGMWVEPDGNLPSGESWTRQLLLGQRYFASRFGSRPRVAWIPDSFGFPGNLPQLLRLSGIEYFFTHKLTWNEHNPFPYDLYWWEGLDGSRVLAHSFFNPERGYNGDVCAKDVGETWRNFKTKMHHDQTLLAVGYGDGGGGPTAEMLERFERLRAFPGLPKLEMGKVETFYDRISAKTLPTWVGEKYLEYHRATYTTQARIKWLHRRLEQAISDAEIATSLDRSYPTSQINQLWQTLLLHEFHDILPGSSIRSVYESGERALSAALESAQSIRDNALSHLSDGEYGTDEKYTTYGRDVLSVWNLQFEDRPLRVEIEDPSLRAKRFIAGERKVFSQITADNSLLLAAPQILVPPFGSIALSSRDSEGSETYGKLRGSDTELENEFLRVVIGADGTITSLYDKEHQRETTADRTNQIWLFTDIPRQFEAWDIDASYPSEGLELRASEPPKQIEPGPVRTAIRISRQVDDIRIVQEYRLYNSERLLEIRTRVKWHGRRRFLRALFPVNVRAHEGWTETAFGAVPRATHRNTSWEEAKFEVPGHRWADLSEPGYGVSLLTDSKYGYSIRANMIGLSLLRSPIYPDPFADEGDHEFVYALYPHSGDWRNGTVRAARNLNSSLYAIPSGSEEPRQQLSLPRSFVASIRLTKGRLELSALKQAEESDSLILRLYEPHGDRGVAAIESKDPIRKATLVNLLEEPIADLPVQDRNRVEFTYTPFQVVTLRLE